MALSTLLPFLLLLSTPSTTSTPIPLALTPRAGGPAFQPLAPSCTLTNPIPPNTTNQKPCPTISLTHGIYSSYFLTPQYTSEQKATNCYEQCHGFTGCVAAVMADQVPTPSGYYGSEGGELVTACLFFNQTLTRQDFVEAEQGEYIGVYAGNIHCTE